MRRAVLIVLATLVAGPFALPASASTPPCAAPPSTHGPSQSVAASVLLPTRFASDPDSAFPGASRRAWLAAADTNGLIGHVFTVDPETWGGAFDLSVTGDLTGMADLGIYFYDDFGTILAVNSGDEGIPTTTAEYDENAVGGEVGAIPHRSVKAIVFMKTGLQAVFAYEAVGRARVSVTGCGFAPRQITIRAGQEVEWTNVDTKAHSVTSNDRDFFGAILFDNNLGKGAVARYTFWTSGTYTYRDKASGNTGTVKVIGEFGTPA